MKTYIKVHNCEHNFFFCISVTMGLPGKQTLHYKYPIKLNFKINTNDCWQIFIHLSFVNLNVFLLLCCCRYSFGKYNHNIYFLCGFLEHSWFCRMQLVLHFKYKIISFLLQVGNRSFLRLVSQPSFCVQCLNYSKYPVTHQHLWWLCGDTDGLSFAL